MARLVMMHARDTIKALGRQHSMAMALAGSQAAQGAGPGSSTAGRAWMGHMVVQQHRNRRGALLTACIQPDFTHLHCPGASGSSGNTSSSHTCTLLLCCRGKGGGELLPLPPSPLPPSRSLCLGSSVTDAMVLLLRLQSCRKCNHLALREAKPVSVKGA